MKKSILIFLSAIIAVSLFVSCNGDPGTNVETKIVITFDKNGGTGVMAALSAKKGENVKLTANTFTWAENAFKGWNTKADGSGFFYENEATDKFDSDTTLYAQWVEIKTITFNANDGSVMPATKTQVVEKGVETALEANTFTYSGFAFTKWNTAADGSGTDYANGKKVSLDNNLELYAIWAVKTDTPYKVNHYIKNLTGDEYTLSSTDNKNDTTGVVLTLADLTKSIEGFTYSEGFAGTETKGTTKPTSGSVTTATVIGEGNLVIDLYYSRDIHTVTLTNGTGVSSTSGAGTYAYGATVSIDATLQDGYKFDNWTVSSTSTVVSTTKAYIFTMGAEDLSYTANASAITSFTVFFDKNGGSGSMDSQNFTYGVPQSLRSNTFTKAGSIFNGWNTSSDGTGDSYLNEQDGSKISTTSGTVTLYAQWWQPKVTFYGNGATSGSTSVQSVDYNTATTLSDNAFAKANNVFYGWNTKADGSGESYTNKQSVTLTASLELYAQWAVDLHATQQTSWGGTNGNAYTITANTDISDRITVTGSVKLLLPDGMTLNAQKGITVAGSNELTIDKFGSTAEGTGTLTATGDNHCAGIGGNEGTDAGTVIINAGNINVIGGYEAAGIGGGFQGSGGIITINNGTITATGGNSGAGIGGGSRYFHSPQGGDGGQITINGGSVNATGGDYASGIGGGYKGEGGTVEITGGMIEAYGKVGGAGIGGGCIGLGGDVTISGGIVTAQGGDRVSAQPKTGGAGIGSGGWTSANVSAMVTISGGTVTATGGVGASGIGGGGCGPDESGGKGLTVIITRGTVTATGGTDGYGIGGGYGYPRGSDGNLQIGVNVHVYKNNEPTAYVDGPQDNVTNRYTKMTVSSGT